MRYYAVFLIGLCLSVSAWAEEPMYNGIPLQLICKIHGSFNDKEIKSNVMRSTFAVSGLGLDYGYEAEVNYEYIEDGISIHARARLPGPKIIPGVLQEIVAFVTFPDGHQIMLSNQGSKVVLMPTPKSKSKNDITFGCGISINDSLGF